MDEILSVMTMGRMGLTLNRIGTIFVALSFGKNLEDAHQLNDTGRRVYLASFRHPTLFRRGLGLPGLGFVLQMLDH